MKSFLSLKKAALCSALALASLTAAQSVHADTIFSVDLDVSSLLGNSGAPFSLDFQFNAGSGTASNTITLSNFSFANGSAVGAPVIFSGAATGNLTSAIVMTTSSTLNPFNEFAQQFAAGTTSIHFVVDSTNNLTGTTPAGFLVSIDDSSTFQIPTTAPDGISLLTETIGSTAAGTLAGIQVYQSSGVGAAGFDTSGVTASTPETGPGLWMLSAMAGIAVLVSRRPQLRKA